MTSYYKISISSEFDEAEDLKRLIAQFGTSLAGDLTLDIQTAGPVFRGEAQTVIIALIASGTSVITALITVLLNIYQKKTGAIIKIRTRDGDELEFPATMSKKEVETLIHAHKQIAADTIRIIKP